MTIDLSFNAMKTKHNNFITEYANEQIINFTKDNDNRDLETIKAEISAQRHIYDDAELTVLATYQKASNMQRELTHIKDKILVNYQMNSCICRVNVPIHCCNTFFAELIKLN